MNSFVKVIITLVILALIAGGLYYSYNDGSFDDFIDQYLDGGANITQDSNKMLVAVYIVGSNLEDNDVEGEQTKGFATYNLNQAVKALKGLSELEDQAFDMFVAFGGARSTGWEGIKYANEACIIKDSGNGYYGDDDCYSYENADVDMSSPVVYTDFLKKSKEMMDKYDRTMLINWNHGGDYMGYGQDSNKGYGILSLPELKSSIDAADVKFDMVGFDACLMAGLEVADIYVGRTDYLVVSEETEPGTGWNYTDVVNNALEYIDEPIEEYGKSLIDAYMENDEKSSGKTLSLIEMSKIPEVTNTLNAVLTKYSSTNANYQNFIFAVQNSEKYGVISEENDAYSVDLKDLVNNLKSQTNDEAKSSELESLNDALKQAVIYTRNDGSRPNSSGLSIFSILNYQMWVTKGYNDSNSVSDVWYDSVSKLYAEVANDNEKPVIGTLEDCEDSEESSCIKVTDNIGLKSVYDVVAKNSATAGEYIVLKGKLFNGEGDGDFSVSKSDLTGAIGICHKEGDDACSDTPVELTYIEAYSGDEYSEYHTFGKVNGKDALIVMLADSSGLEPVSKRSIYYSPINIVGGKPYPSKQQIEFKNGDKIVPLYRIISTTGTTKFEEGDSTITVDGKLGLTTMPTTGSNYVNYILAVDIRGNAVAKKY